ncbi:GTPase regulator Nrf1 [Apiotrichum porosum]|uniref:GTPase regulator Nrf1 n=1 Tax=Apiotrichum porosum TaxID=105984 RepID=A0A427XH85_9TREE|nr:GTPase regulator Nrf1 [Apiotrichum porosum]RSH78074.1 GTPase regulator Nrf1 [Apiotrichum porosum]
MSTQPLLQRTAKKRIALPVRVEPKVFFANERTFLSWLHFAVILGGLAVGLLNFGDKLYSQRHSRTVVDMSQAGRISAALYTAIAVGVMIYALSVYQRRAKAIRERSGAPYDDRFGPTVLCVCLLAAIGTNFVLRAVYE